MISTSIKRLTKPRFKHEFTTLYDPVQFQAIPLIGSDLQDAQEELMQNELLNSNDVSYDGIESDAALSYNPSFGKICTGE